MVALALTIRQKPKRISPVDGDADAVETIGSGLRSKGCVVSSYDDPSTILAQFVPKVFDIVVLDVRTGSMDGLELYRSLKGLNSRLTGLLSHTLRRCDCRQARIHVLPPEPGLAGQSRPGRYRSQPLKAPKQQEHHA